MPGRARALQNAGVAPLGPAPGVLALLLVAAAAHAGELLYVSEGNRLRRVDLASVDAPPLRQDVLVPSARDAPERGRDVNGAVCPLPDGSGRFVLGEDTGQPHPPAGWAVMDARGRPLGKLTPAPVARKPEPYGCAFDHEGRLFTTEVGDPGFGSANGRLLVWFPPFRGFPGPPGVYPETDAASSGYCVIADDVSTAGAVLVDDAGRVLVASASRLAIRRFRPPFPTSATPAGGCGRHDAVGAPRADDVRQEVLVRAPATFAGLARAPGGNLYASSVLTGRIYEIDPDGAIVRSVLTPPEWLPPFSTGHPMGLAVDADGTLYYADLDLAFSLTDVVPGPDGKVRRIRFDADGSPLPPEVLLDGLAFPDAVSVVPGELARDPSSPAPPPSARAGTPRARRTSRAIHTPSAAAKSVESRSPPATSATRRAGAR